jgi:chemotaxis protein methyltransferase CheR
VTTACLSEDALSFVCTLVRRQAAIELDASKSYLIDARLAPLAKKNGLASAAEFIHMVREKRHPGLESQLVEAMTTNETSFFRDLHPFDALRKHILPSLTPILAPARALNVWSAACSTGQELFSVAMLLREHCPEMAAWKLRLLGTDISDEVLTRARAASFTQIEVNRGLPAPLLVKYFQRKGARWELRPEITAMAEFRKLNLVEPWTCMPRMDVVFLRNVLIYFAPETKKQILRKVREIMAPHAVLFLGAAESTLNLDDNFERVPIDGSVYYRLKQGNSRS